MSKLSIPATDCSGNFAAYVALPEKTPAPVIILIQEIFGINQEMRDKCEHMADLGYVAICPDLFWRIEPGIELVDSIEEQLTRAFQLFGEFDQQKGIEDLKAALSFARSYEHGDGQAACMGYCLGGKLAYMMAAQTDIDASVSYYGVGIEAMLGDAKNIKKPLLLHIAGADQYVPKDAQEKIKAELENNEHVDLYVYPGMEHAFARGNGMHYNKEAADLANARTEKFLEDALDSGCMQNKRRV